MPVPSSQRIISRHEQGVLILKIVDAHLRGYSVAKALRQELLTAIPSEGSPKVVLDFQSVVSFSSEAFRPLLSVRRHVVELGGRLILCNLAPMVAQAFSSTRLIGSSQATGSSFDVQADVAASIEALLQEAD